jgi:hypothetical protein
LLIAVLTEPVSRVTFRVLLPMSLTLMVRPSTAPVTSMLSLLTSMPFTFSLVLWPALVWVSPWTPPGS